jgi:hypothetical protein
LVLDVLASAHAELGDFSAASRFSAEAIERLGPGQQAIRPAITRRFQSYQSGKAHRDKDGMYP